MQRSKRVNPHAQTFRGCVVLAPRNAPHQLFSPTKQHTTCAVLSSHTAFARMRSARDALGIIYSAVIVRVWKAYFQGSTRVLQKARRAKNKKVPERPRLSVGPATRLVSRRLRRRRHFGRGITRWQWMRKADARDVFLTKQGLQLQRPRKAVTDTLGNRQLKTVPVSTMHPAS